MFPTLRLFKALPIPAHTNLPLTAASLAYLPQGFIVTPDVVANYPNLTAVMDTANTLYGKDTHQLNAALHKSFAKVRDASIQQLYFEQVLHYLTTYGADYWNTYSDEMVFIPGEVLQAPELSAGARFTVIRGLTKDELKSELFTLINSGIALGEQTLDDVATVAAFVGVVAADLEQVRNKEAKILLYRQLGIVPTDPVEFLRYVVYLATGNTLLVKNTKTIEALKVGFSNELSVAFSTYEKNIGLHRLSEIFYRYKPLFLAFRKTPQMKRMVNKIRRLAPTHHVPFKDDYLNTITAKLKRGEAIQQQVLEYALKKATPFRKIRLLYALRYRMNYPTSIVYRVRTGRAWATDVSYNEYKDIHRVHTAVLASLVQDVHSQVDGKKVYIPTGLEYGVPATEKQFTGNLPSGTSVTLDEDMVCGIHWMNGEVSDTWRSFVDLDLSLVNATEKFGWNSYWRDNSRGIHFSGDVTSAPPPNGASEWYRIQKTKQPTNWLMMVNYYNHSEYQVPCKIVVGKASAITKKHVIDPNKVVALTTTTITDEQKILGVITGDQNELRFYFAESNVGRGRASVQSDQANHAREYLIKFYTNTLSLNDLLSLAGAKFVDSPEEADIDLSPEAVDKTTFIRLLTGSER